jgi:hypothetical protein
MSAYQEYVPYPISAEARGRVRVWRGAVERNRAQLLAAFDSPEVLRAATDFHAKGKNAVHHSHRSGAPRKGADRALRHLRGIFEKHGARWTPNVSPPRWGYINAQGPIFSEGSFEELQSGVAIGSITLDSGLLCHVPLWTIVATDHAVCRISQRRPGVDISAALWEAHANALNLSASRTSERFRLPAAGGCFSAEWVVGEAPSGERAAFLRASTWVHSDMLYEEQEAEIALAGEVGDRLGEFVLLLRTLPSPQRA